MNEMFSWQIVFLDKRKIILLNITLGSAFQFLLKKGSVLLVDFYGLL